MIKPMLATLTDKPFDNENWLFEIKYDGYRIIAYIDKGDVKLKTRKNVDYTSKFKDVTQALSKWKVEAIVDGEIVVLNDDGVSDFNALQNYRAGDALYFYVFDLLYLNGKDYRDKPLLERKAALKKVLPKLPGIRYCDHIAGAGIKAFEGAKQLGLEGLIAKRANSLYTAGRTKDWLKIKVTKEGEFYIAGFTRQTEYSTISSLILADKDSTGFHYAGDVGTGFNDREIRAILKRIKLVTKCLLAEPVTIGRGRWSKKAPAEVIWCKPVVRCRVRYLERTEAGELRHAAFVGLV